MALQTERTDLDSLVLQVGEVQINPTANTVLDRLKTIATNTATYSPIPTSITQEYIRPTEFEISGEITRSANTTPYTINQIIGGTGETTMTLLDFTTLGSVNNRKLQINNISLYSSYGSATVKLNPIIHVCNTSTLSGQTQTDTTTFNPSYAETIAKDVLIFDNLSTIINHGSGYYKLFQAEIIRNCTLNSSGQLYFCIISNGSYTPASGELISVVLKGYLL